MDRLDTRIFHLEAFIESLNIDFAVLYNEHQGSPPKDMLDDLINRRKGWEQELTQLKKNKKRLQKIQKITGDGRH